MTEFNQIKELEKALANPEIRKSISELSNLLADDFIEFGSSGRVYNKKQTIKALRKIESSKISLINFKFKQINKQCILVTYKSVVTDERQKKHSLRSSLWKKENGKWKIVFHQGTNLN